MSNEIIMTVVGNLTANPELRYTQNGLPVANFTIASTPRIFDKAKNEWVDGEATFLRCSVWRDYAENIAGSLTKGTRVIATGRFKVRSYEDKEGNRRTSNELEVDEIGPSLRYATAAVQRIQRDHGTRQEPSPYQSEQDQAWASASDEPWATPATGVRPQPTGSGEQPTFDEPWAAPGAYDSETPF